MDWPARPCWALLITTLFEFSVWRAIVSLLLSGTALAGPTFVSAQTIYNQGFFTLNKSVRHSFQIFTDGQRGLLLVSNSGGVEPLWIDGATMRQIDIDTSAFAKLRPVSDYEGSTLPIDSPLSRIGCRSWAFCGGLESVDFVIRVRDGRNRHEIEVMYSDFRPGLENLEKLLGGAASDTMETSDEFLTVVQTSVRGRWRARLKDAIRGISTREEMYRLQANSAMNVLVSLPAMADVDAPNQRGQLADLGSGFGLVYELSLAWCKAWTRSEAENILAGRSARALLSDVLRPGTTCLDRFSHVADLLDSYAPTERSRLLDAVRKYAIENKSEIGAQLVTSLGGTLTSVPTVSRPHLPSQNQSRTAPPTSTTGLAITPTPNSTQSLNDQELTFLEFSSIKKVPNQLTLLAFSEANRALERDRTALGTSILRAVALDPRGEVRIQARLAGLLKDGRFEIEVFGNDAANVKMQLGSYRVKLAAKLTVGRIDICNQIVRCIFSEKEKVSTESRQEQVEFILSKQNNHRASRRISFGPLLPFDADRGGFMPSRLVEVQLNMDLIGKIELQ